MREIIYLGRDNEIVLDVLEAGVPIDQSAVTRTVLLLNGPSQLELDSDQVSDVFAWSAGGRLTITAGGQQITPGSYTARLIIYDATHPAGLVWGEAFQITVTQA